MRVSKRKVNTTLEKELFTTFYQVVADLRSPEEAKVVFSDLLGKNELTSIVKRLAVAYWLAKGRSVTNIKENLAVSPATIESIKHDLRKSQGFTIALSKITAEEWANKWAQRIRKFVK